MQHHLTQAMRIAAGRRRQLNSSATVAFLYLAEAVDEHLCAVLSIQEITALTGLPRQTAWRALHALKAAGLLTATERVDEDNARRANLYYLTGLALNTVAGGRP